MIDLNMIVTFSNGVQVLNCTPHELTFLDGEDVVTAPVSGAKINARAVEEVTRKAGAAVFVRTVFLPSDEGLEELSFIERETPGVLIVGSMISAQAYPGKVVAMTAAPGFERVPPAEKRMSTSKFTVF